MIKSSTLLMVAGLVWAGSALAAGTDLQTAVRQGDQAAARGDYGAAAELYRTAVKAGDGTAETRLGWLYRNGTGVAQSDAMAFDLFVLAAGQGNAGGQFSLARLYELGRGTRQDFAEAVRWYRAAALQGNAQAQNNLGWAYQTGRGIGQDFAEAAVWYRRAADQGQRDALGNLGLLTLDGKGVPQDAALGEKLLRQAAAQGDADAQSVVARLEAERPQAVGTAKPRTVFGVWRSKQAVKDEGLRQMYLILDIRHDAVTFKFDCRFLDGSIVVGSFNTLAQITDSSIRVVIGGSSQSGAGDNQCSVSVPPSTLPYHQVGNEMSITIDGLVVTMVRGG